MEEDKSRSTGPTPLYGSNNESAGGDDPITGSHGSSPGQTVSPGTPMNKEQAPKNDSATLNNSFVPAVENGNNPDNLNESMPDEDHTRLDADKIEGSDVTTPETALTEDGPNIGRGNELHIDDRKAIQDVVHSGQSFDELEASTDGGDKGKTEQYEVDKHATQGHADEHVANDRGSTGSTENKGVSSTVDVVVQKTDAKTGGLIEMGIIDPDLHRRHDSQAGESYDQGISDNTRQYTKASSASDESEPEPAGQHTRFTVPTLVGPAPEPTDILQDDVLEDVISGESGQSVLSFPLGPHTSAADDELLATTGLHSRLDEWHRKKYLGGYRDRRTQVEYFHAQTQTTTPQEIRAQSAPLRFHRDTQTKFIRHRHTQGYRDSASQMTKPGCYISTETDHIIVPKRYTTADEHEAWIVSNVIKLQCWVRRVYACRKARRLRKERDERTRALLERERRRKELAEKRRRKEIESRLHPKTNKDFEILYSGLETWRQQETGKINKAGYSEPARLAALADLLDQEAALIQKIDRLKIAANEENRERKIVRLLEAMSSSKKWAVKKYGIVSVDTPNTIRARELRDLYHALNVPLISVDERLQILLHVKYTVKEFDCNLTREIVELIDREGDLVSRGRDAKSMEGLRRRISNLFLQFIQTPEFNPEAGIYQKFPDAGQSWKRDQAVYYCRSCTRYLPSTEFYLSTTMKHLGKCKACTSEENLATSRKDDSVYSDLLKLIRLQESQRRITSGAPEDAHYNAISLLQESDMRYIVDKVWNRQSAVSGSRALESLVLTRWNPNVELSPWNCILLTKAEAATHDRQAEPEELYSEEFIRKIQQKHLAAKQHFSQLPAMEKYFRRHYVDDGNGKMVPIPLS